MIGASPADEVAGAGVAVGGGGVGAGDTTATGVEEAFVVIVCIEVLVVAVSGLPSVRKTSSLLLK